MSKQYPFGSVTLGVAEYRNLLARAGAAEASSQIWQARYEDAEARAGEALRLVEKLTLDLMDARSQSRDKAQQDITRCPICQKRVGLGVAHDPASHSPDRTS